MDTETRVVDRTPPSEGLRTGALCMIGSATLLLLSALIHPQGKSDYSEQLDLIASGTVRWYVGHLIFLIGLGLLIPTALTLRRLSRGSAPLLGTIGASLATIGVMAFTGFIAIDGFVFWAMSSPERDPKEMAELMAVLDEDPGLFLPFPFLSMALNVGLILLAIAVLRAKVVPVWMLAVLALSGVVRAVGRPSGVWAAITAAEVTSAVALIAIGLTLLARKPPAKANAAS